MALVQISDVIVPELFTGYLRQATEEKWNLLRAGVVARDPFLDGLLTGQNVQPMGGKIFNIPSWNPLERVEENISTDTEYDVIRAAAGGSFPNPRGDAVPQNITAAREIAVRLSRNQHWSTSDLARSLAGEDPLSAIIDQVADYWNIRRQKATIAAIQGVFADNAAAPTGTEHVQDDLTLDVSGTSFTPGVTNVTAESIIDASALMGDSATDLTAMMVHSTVMATLRKNDLIDFIQDSETGIRIPTYQEKILIEDDSMPNPAGDSSIGAQTAAGIYHTWLMGPAAVRYGEGSAPVPTAISREELAGNGGGQEILSNRVEWMIHPTGHAFNVTPASIPDGGPSNAATTNNLAHVDSWQRVYAERKQIKIVRLITREA